MTVWLAAGSALALGALLAYLLASRRTASIEARLDERVRESERIHGEARARAAELEAARHELAALQQSNARLAERVRFLETDESKLRETFQGLSADVLKQNSESFLTLAKTDLESRQKAIDEVVKPLRESLEKFDAKLQTVEKERVGAYADLRVQVESMRSTHAQLQSETSKLVSALRAPAVRGRWGEIQLKRVVEMAGMLAHCDFHEQASVTTEDGRIRPDLVVHLAGGKNVVVDAKAPLAAFLKAFETADEETRKACARDHARQVRDHMTKLGAKGYWEQFQPAPEFVVMFLPGEAFFSAALEHEPGLIEFGVEQKVIPASPTTLIALLHAVAYGWRQEQLAENANRISELGKDLYDRIRVWTEHLGKVGKGLEGALGSYNDAVASLERRVLVSARRLKELGAGTSDDVAEVKTIDGRTREVQLAETPATDESGKLRRGRFGDEG